VEHGQVADSSQTFHHFGGSRLILATTNAHKVEEISRILGAVLPDWQFLPRPPEVPEVPEVDSTLEGNASLKAQALVAATGEAALADDSGLFVACLGGEPGVRSARYAGEDADDGNNRAALRTALVSAGHGGQAVAAEFRCAVAVAFANPGATLGQLVVTGRVGGHVITEERGSDGFGYDPMFIPSGGDGRTFAELGQRDKDAISHRGAALRGLVALLGALAAGAN
jgi:XTP/dITP diphosphohydrolase